MEFKHDKLPFDHNDSIQLGFQHVRQLGHGGHSTCFVNEHFPEKQQFPDGARPETNPESVDLTAVTSNENSDVALDNSFSKLSSVGGECGTVRLESGKRPCGVGEGQVVTKRIRQIDRNCSSPVHVAWQGSSSTSITVRGELLSREDCDALDAAEGYHVFNFSTKGTQLEQLSVRPSLLFPGYYEDYHRPVQNNLLEESSPCSSVLFNYLPWKLVALGPDHQAEVPVWRSRSQKESVCPDAPTSFGGILVDDDDDDSDKWIGHCVTLMSDSDPLCLEEAVGLCKVDCFCCLDEGSIRCVRQHVMEAREQLRMSLGHERFTELGLCEMGVDVALGWTEEEERQFHEVVMFNPASLGKNFWDDLPRAFPSRSSKELVCYYYNVFMLQKRAEQNRCDPFNVDSDNDEWQESDQGEEFGTIDDNEDDDSGVESPAIAAHNICHHGDDGELNIHEDEGEHYDDDDEDEDALSNSFHGDDDKLKFGFTAPYDVDVALHGGDSGGEDQDVHDDSCTSYEGQHKRADSSFDVDHADVFECLRDGVAASDQGNHNVKRSRNTGTSSISDQGLAVSLNGYVRGYEIGHCDPRPCEMCSVGYLRVFEKDTDLLPTCNMIEEVFGSES